MKFVSAEDESEFYSIYFYKEVALSFVGLSKGMLCPPNLISKANINRDTQNNETMFRYT